MEREQFVAVIRKSTELLQKVRNVGESGDWDDLYTVVEFLSDAFAQAYPTSPCGAGCSDCCEEALFRVTELEWGIVERYLSLALDVEAQREIATRALEAFGPHRDRLEALGQFWREAPWGAATEIIQSLPMRCPFLRPDSYCGIYEARPLTCRAYGHFGVTIEGRLSMLICLKHGVPFIEGLMDHWGGQYTVAPYEPFFRKLVSMQPETELAPLPLWIVRWAEKVLVR